MRTTCDAERSTMMAIVEHEIVTLCNAGSSADRMRRHVVRTRKLMKLIALVMVLLFFPWAVNAQPAAAPTGVPVQMVVSVEPKKNGGEIPTITQQDIVVHQGHDRRPVTNWVQATGNYGGLALAILIDDGAGPSFGTQLNDIKTFIQEQPSTTVVAVGYMQNGTVFMTHNFTQDHAAAAKSLRLPLGYYGAEASPYVSLSDFIKRWPANPAIPRREVLMISSGIDPLYIGIYPDPYVDTAVQDAQCAHIVVYSIYTPSAGHFGHAYWLTFWGQNFLGQLSQETGGESYYFLGPQAPVSFSPYLDKLNHQLRNQFLLTFLAEPRKKAGRERVNITSEFHSVNLVYADQVCVPASPEQ
jgi:hypothetical protein